MRPLSVIICTHNPRRNYLTRVLDALRAQSLPKKQWELLLIDNASDEPVANRCDLSWHPQARLILEGELGLTPARLRGITESRGELLVFVDDDNVLSRDYLKQAVEVGKSWDKLGAWGAGEITGEFEVEPPRHLVPYFTWIAVFSILTDEWSNAASDNHALPCGAGLCVRRSIALRYKDKVGCDGVARGLGRRGNDTMAGEDTDLALTACDCGMLAGRLFRLRITHLIPKGRLTDEYFVKLAWGAGYSGIFLGVSRRWLLPPPLSVFRKILNYLRLARKSPFQRAVWLATMAGRSAARRELADRRRMENPLSAS